MNEQNAQPGVPPQGAGAYTSGPSAPMPMMAPIAPRRPTLSNAVSLAAVGVMLVIAAVGIVFATGTGSAHAGGMVVLVSTGLIVLTAGGVLIYAAMKGRSAGWFLPFTIVGAVLGIPVILGGTGLMARSAVSTEWSSVTVSGPDGEYSFQVDGSGEPAEWHWTGGSSDEAWEDPSAGAEATIADPLDTDIDGRRDRIILDLTNIPERTDLNYDVALRQSQLAVLIRQDQLPEVWSLVTDDTSTVTATSLALFGDDGELAWDLQNWVDSGLTIDAFPLGSGSERHSPVNRFDFALNLEESSVVHFFVVDSQTPLSIASVSGDQPQSGDEAQSGDESTTSSDGNN